MGHLNVAGWTELNNALRAHILINEKCDVYSINETHLSDNCTFEPQVTGYTFKGHNRSVAHKRAPKTWGGVGFLIKNSIFQEYRYTEVDKTFDGIFAIELTHKAIGTRLLLVSCYLPPENSPYGRDALSFFNHLSALCYSQASEFDRIYFCGDVNSRI